jgi:subtilisin family serine protease
MTRVPRATALALLVAALITAPALGVHGTAAPLCQTPGLVVWLNTQGDGTAGSIYYSLEFTNLSGHACSLNGYPYVYGVSLAGANLGTVASFDHSRQPTAVRIANGATAKAVLRIVEAGNFPPASCHLVEAAGLKVYPPNQTRAARVPFPFQGCSHKGPTYLSVGAVQKP